MSMILRIAAGTVCVFGFLSWPSFTWSQASQREVGCSFMWARAVAEAGGRRLVRYREFLSACPHDPRAATARAEIAQIERRSSHPPAPLPMQPPPAQPGSANRHQELRASTGRSERRRPVVSSYSEPEEPHVDPYRTAATTSMSLAQRLSVAYPGEIITVPPGVYSVGGQFLIGRSIVLRGDISSGVTPTLRGSVIIDADDVEVRDLTIETTDQWNAVRVRRGNVRLINTYIRYVGGRPHVDPAYAITSALVVEGGQVRVAGGTVGPGLGPAVSIGGGVLDLAGSSVLNGDYLAIFAFGGTINISQTRISSRWALLVRGSAQASLGNSVIDTDRSHYAVVAGESATLTLTDNRFLQGENRNWLCVEDTVRRHVGGNVDSAGQAFSEFSLVSTSQGDSCSNESQANR